MKYKTNVGPLKTSKQLIRLIIIVIALSSYTSLVGYADEALSS